MCHLGNFKALEATYVIVCDAVQSGKKLSATSLKGATYITASAGYHGLSVAAGARIFGANAIIYFYKRVLADWQQVSLDLPAASWESNSKI
ncbi:MAG: diaminopropionate ammonia-lyase [Paraglaciecola sp.]